jgi:pimeloyl-ACP methyl ester carboxylesterase
MIILIIAILILCSTLLNFIMINKENGKYQAPGKLIEIDGHRMHIYAEGEGTTTVVMTCGSGTPCAYTDYSAIRPKISELARVCIYERPGYGWSEAAISPRSTEQIIEDLRELLIKANENPPYIFVAHSMGAMEALLYAHKYPDEVDGIVLIDGTSPYKHINYPQSSIPAVGIWMIKALSFTGVLRLITELNIIPMLSERLRYMPRDKRNIEKAMIYKNIMNDMVIKEGITLEDSAKSMESDLDLGDIPIIVVTAGKSLKWLSGWRESQDSLLKLSRNSKQIIINDAFHVSIHLKHGEEIAGQIKELVESVQNNRTRKKSRP